MALNNDSSRPGTLATVAATAAVTLALGVTLAGFSGYFGRRSASPAAAPPPPPSAVARVSPESPPLVATNPVAQSGHGDEAEHGRAKRHHEREHEHEDDDD